MEVPSSFIRFIVNGILPFCSLAPKSWFCLLNLDSNCRDIKQSLETCGDFKSGDSDVHV